MHVGIYACTCVYVWSLHLGPQTDLKGEHWERTRHYIANNCIQDIERQLTAKNNQKQNEQNEQKHVEINVIDSKVTIQTDKSDMDEQASQSVGTYDFKYFKQTTTEWQDIRKEKQEKGISLTQLS